MRLFRSKASSDRKGSLDSNVIPTYKSDHPSGDPTRRKSSIGRLLRRKDQVTVTPTYIRDVPSNRLKKNQNDFPSVDVSQSYRRDKQTGEQVIDHTDLLHSLVHHESADDVPQANQFNSASSGPPRTGGQLLSILPTKIWLEIFDSLPLVEKVCLSLTCKAFRHYLVPSEAELELPENQIDRTDLLLRLDESLPNHLFCFNCNIYHPRLNPRKESLRPTNVANPVFQCPYAQNLDKRISRIRLTSGRTIPFTFVQLLTRAHYFSLSHGITLDSHSRRWRDRDDEWSHQTRFAMINNHLLLRVVSTKFVAAGLPPAGLRNLLYNPQEEFHPFFSTCPHWRDGELMPTVKCAISHIPKPIEGGGIDRVGKEVIARINAPKTLIITLCDNCRPIRRCPRCPTEYLIETKRAEDRHETDPTKTFKQALVVTRWSDLGDGSTPTGSREWAACTGDLKDYDSFAVLGKRAISGVFESFFNPDTIPPQRLLNMNPNDEKLGEEGHKWY